MLTQNLDQLQGSSRDFHSNCWVNLRILGRLCDSVNSTFWPQGVDNNRRADTDLAAEIGSLGRVKGRSAIQKQSFHDKKMKESWCAGPRGPCLGLAGKRELELELEGFPAPGSSSSSSASSQALPLPGNAHTLHSERDTASPKKSSPKTAFNRKTVYRKSQKVSVDSSPQTGQPHKVRASPIVSTAPRVGAC